MELRAEEKGKGEGREKFPSYETFSFPPHQCHFEESRFPDCPHRPCESLTPHTKNKNGKPKNPLPRQSTHLLLVRGVLIILFYIIANRNSSQLTTLSSPNNNHHHQPSCLSTRKPSTTSTSPASVSSCASTSMCPKIHLEPLPTPNVSLELCPLSISFSRREPSQLS